MKRAASRFFLLLLGLIFSSGARAFDEDAMWNLEHSERYQRYAAKPDSRLVRQMLALPITEDFGPAETARIALFVMHQREEAKLLRAWMEYDVVAELLKLPRKDARTVGEAIAQQRKSPERFASEFQSRAFAIALEQTGRPSPGWVDIERRQVRLDPSRMMFGYPANRDGAPRQKALVLLGASSCLDRGTCTWNDFTEYVQHGTERTTGFTVAQIAGFGMFVFGFVNLVFRRTRASTVCLLAARACLIPAICVLFPLSYHAFFDEFRTGEGAAAGVVIVYFIRLGFGLVEFLAACLLVYLVLRRSRDEREENFAGN